MSVRVSTYDDFNISVTCPRVPSNRQDQYMRKAAQCAFRSNMVQRHGCVIVDCASGDIVSKGYNKKTAFADHHSSCFANIRYSVHAEVDALSKLRKSMNTSNLEMYVVRIGSEMRGAPLKLSMPCCSCSQAINKSSIRRVFYSM